MTFQEHITQAQTMIRALPVIDDIARDAIASTLSSAALTRAEVTDLRLRLRNMPLLSPDGTKAKEAVDKVLLGLMTKMPQEESPIVRTETPPLYRTRKKPVPGRTETIVAADETRGSLFELLISTALKDKEAKKLSLAFWEKLTIEIERNLSRQCPSQTIISPS